jgi:hypothetical protein
MGQDHTPYNAKKADLAIEVYKSLRIEIMEYITTLRNMEFGCVAGMAAAYYFLFSALFKFEPGNALVNRNIIFALFILPVLLPLFCIFKVRSIFRHMTLINEYMESLETKFDSGGFWEALIFKERRRNADTRIKAIGRTQYWAFGLLTIAGVIAGGIAWLGSLSLRQCSGSASLWFCQ